MTTTYHLRVSGGALSVVVIAEQHYGPCRLSDDNNNNNYPYQIQLLKKTDKANFMYTV